MEFEDIYKGIDWKYFIIGAALFAFIAIAAMDYNLDIILVFSSVGLLIIGYKSRNLIQGVVLGALGTIPLFIATIYGERLGEVVPGNDIVFWILISFLAIGAFCGFTGAYFSRSRKIAIEKQASIGKGRKKKNT
ncbi:hypothetical protein MBCUT_17670 [Methanobrevibacter cuticularis]|uniref:Uncharacterized protein n=1 Tax=Methanobrevibacter cuticularis TaxID=47311 RepID=A0A166CZF3_9EURY|nr:hypothetical protein [Methanobrevibacter cuticularis]KZX15033.1 hypothetical protein MBCUT_17670 [Methanobrevibacter cuticularis]